jgi:hypothetical protein
MGVLQDETQQVPPEQTSAEQANSSSRPTTRYLLFLGSTLFSIITLSFV